MTVILDEKNEIDFENVSFLFHGSDLVIDNSVSIQAGSYEQYRSLTLTGISNENRKLIESYESVNVGVVTDSSEIKSAYSISIQG
ncbi:hypothetical protein LMH73_027015 [Vibrio splendidus]|nr:hypothetical protein [Vibrio splendidus]MCC4880301.1 hypothetical protein [Vibrio splendidus]